MTDMSQFLTAENNMTRLHYIPICNSWTMIESMHELGC